MTNQKKSLGVQTAEAFLSNKVPEGIKCTLRRDLFSHCSYCSRDLGTKGWPPFSWLTTTTDDPAVRCAHCGWVYCQDHVNKDTGVCQTCCDTTKSKTCLKITCLNSVLIVGAGMGGLATAAALKHRGVHEVTILERTRVLRTSGGPINLQTNAMRALLDIDPSIMAHVFDTAGPLDDDGAFQTLDGKKLFEARLSTRKESRWGNPEGRSIVRGYLQQILYDQCIELGVKIHLGIKAVNVQQTDCQVFVTGKTQDEAQDNSGKNSISATTTKERIFVADLLVAADGIWSKIRSQIFPDAPRPIYQGYQMIVSRAPAHEFDQMLVDCWGELWGKAHRFGFFRCGSSGTALYYARTVPEDMDRDKTQEQLKEILIESVIRNGYNDKITALAKAADVSRMYLFPIRHLPPMSHHISGRVVLLGDAANGMPPNLGQGGGMALESASILSQCLLIEDSLDEALAKYETRRVGRCSVVAKKSKSSGDLFQASNAVTVFLRNALFAYLGRQSTQEGVNELDLPDPFAYLFSYRLVSWPHRSEASDAVIGSA